ncbi:unnamed protein product [Clonostachys rhizophaga]|uniref:F-box domain-containing protein n=1 Tax=Clonostachys rhizophaga TaxID=160324 RepID=A0A9N9VIT0_9HYPO|nr:unnamed protein product [Clonostachys rhizophaga]
MTPIKFEDIPDECIGEIIEPLMYEDTLSSLKSLSLTNHRLRAISMHYLLRRISLRLPCAIVEFHRQIASRIWLLWRYDAFSSVRRLVAGPWYAHWNGLLDISKPEPEDKGKAIQFDLAKLNSFYGSAEKNVFQNGELQVEFNQDCANRILIELLNTLSGLSYFVSPGKMPAALLQALELKHPKCRLHIYDFRNDSAVDIDLVTSPCLYRIGCTYSDASGAGRPKCDLRSRVMAIIAGMAPSLQVVSMVNQRVNEPLFSSEEAENAHWESQEVPFAPHHMFTEQAFPRRLGQLKRLYLKGHCRYPIRLDQWANTTDFTLLESLALEINFSKPDLDSLQVHGIFPCLKTMNLRLYREYEGLHELEDEYRHQLIKILSNLPPLQSLKLTGYIWPEILARALLVHGQSLETLALFPVSSERRHESGELLDRHFREYESLVTEEILDILSQCPLLDELSIPVERTYDNAGDPAIYEAMGALKHLRSATLFLDCFAITLDDRDLYEEPDLLADDERSDAVDGMRKALWACALDEHLAWDILYTITGGRDKHVLQELRILSSANAKEASDLYGTEMGTIIHNLAEDYTFTKEPDGTMVGRCEWVDDAERTSGDKTFRLEEA